MFVIALAAACREPRPLQKLPVLQRCGPGPLTGSLEDKSIESSSTTVDQLFNRFKGLHARAQYPGSGLGLALCKRIIERHGGEIWAESKPDIGTTISFTIPF
ncbi:MAG: hypothetical protein K2X81_08175 [Candidatus Obscuribacterales bacterium]|nr:hypothetical protein [Candidatus Obscuribacterales bacterium]